MSDAANNQAPKRKPAGELQDYPPDMMAAAAAGAGGGGGGGGGGKGLPEESPSRARVRTESWEADPAKAMKSVLSRVLMKHTDTPVTATLRVKDAADSYVEYSGFSFGAEKDVTGEVVFNTGMVGYPEALTDLSLIYI